MDTVFDGDFKNVSEMKKPIERFLHLSTNLFMASFKDKLLITLYPDWDTRIQKWRVIVVVPDRSEANLYMKEMKNHLGNIHDHPNRDCWIIKHFGIEYTIVFE